MMKIKRESSIAGFNIQMHRAVGNIAMLGEYVNID
jgi:hypothetical protein